jgi:AraC family transcriptional regulator
MNEYIGRINKVIDYIDNNLEKSFSLEELASIAHFSKFHFHRLFVSIMGETLFRFILRVRLERAANKLVYEAGSTITNISLDCGFSSSAAFSKSFKEKFKISPTDWKKKSLFSKQINLNSNLRQIKSNHLEAYSKSLTYLGIQNSSQKWKLTAKGLTQVIEIYDHPEIRAVYVRHVGPYQQDFDLFENLTNRLFKWAAPRGLVKFPETQYFIIAHDDPVITDDEKLRISVCLSVKDDIETDGEIGNMVIPAGAYAHIKFRLKPMEIGTAWGWVYGCWLPVSGFIPDDRPCFERYPMDGTEKGFDDLIDLEICVPVKPL